MKKVNTAYMLKWIALAAAVAIAAVAAIYMAAGTAAGTAVVTVAMLLLIVVDFFLIPRLKTRTLEKKAAALAGNFPHQYTFTAHDGIFYFDLEGGRAAVVWRNNPDELQSIDPARISDICAKDGRVLNGTNRVWCQFALSGQKIRIYTLLVRGNRQLGMKDPRVLEAVSKADQLAEVLNQVKAKAAAR